MGKCGRIGSILLAVIMATMITAAGAAPAEEIRVLSTDVYTFLQGGTIVTNEKLGDNKAKDYKIPNVCQALNIPYMNLHTFLDQILE